MFEMTNACACHRDTVFVCGGDRCVVFERSAETGHWCRACACLLSYVRSIFLQLPTLGGPNGWKQRKTQKAPLVPESCALVTSLIGFPWLAALECLPRSPSKSLGRCWSVANRRVQFPTVRCRRTGAGFRAVWHAGDGILDLCLCLAAFHHRPHQNSRGTAAGTWRRQDHAVWPTVFCDSPGRFWFRAFHPHGEYCGPRATLDSRAYVLGLSGGPRFSWRGAQYRRSRQGTVGTAGCGSGRNDAADLRIRNGPAGRRCEPRQQIFLGSGPETTCLQRWRFRFRDVAVEHAEHAAHTVVARTADRCDRCLARHSAILRGHCLRYSTGWSICCIRNTCREFRCKSSLPNGSPGEFS